MPLTCVGVQLFNADIRINLSGYLFDLGSLFIEGVTLLCSKTAFTL